MARSGTPPETPRAVLPEDEADARLRLNRFDLAALMAKADHRFLAGDHRSASAFFTFAATSFDAVQSPEVLRAVQMKDWLAERFRQHVLSGLERAGLDSQDWPPRFREAVEIVFGERQRHPVTEPFPQMPTMFFYPGLPYVDFADPALFPWREALEDRYRELRGEAETLLAHTSDFSPYVRRSTTRPQGDVHGLLENADWSTLYLWNSGQPVEENVRRCPRTFEAVSEVVPLCHVGTKAPGVMFSLLKPGGHIPPHTGKLNVRYICHLPLIVPDGCTFRVGERSRGWQEGRLLAFDDTVEHEARNAGRQDRLVLLFDVWNPHLAAEEKHIVRTLLEVVDEYR